jgi:hypothetical protein
MATKHALRSGSCVKYPGRLGLDTVDDREDRTAVLTDEQRTEVRAICDEICERLETGHEYSYNLDERRGKAGSFADEVWEQALVLLRGVGLDAQQSGDVIVVRKP